MSPREIIAVAVGVLIGAFLNARREPCRKACCVDEAARARRKERWIRGQEYEHAEIPPRPFAQEEPARFTTMPDGAESCPKCGTARNGGLIGLHECRAQA